MAVDVYGELARGLKLAHAEPGNLRDTCAVRRTAVSSPTSEAHPFLKWVGGKRQLVPRLLEHVGQIKGTYHEPFVGGGALFFALRPARAVLSDGNERLIRTYKGIRDNVEGVIAQLQEWPYDKDFFYGQRKRDIDTCADVDVAAWMIYLNRAGFNGLYRVNSRNQFNVPFGRYTNPTICNADNLRACSTALQGIGLHHAPYVSILSRAKRGDFVYFDPPYVPLSATSYFTSYTADGFTREDQVALRDVALQLKKRGIRVLLSNSSAGLVRELYADGFEMAEVMMARNVNCKPGGRGKVPELIMW